MNRIKIVSITLAVSAGALLMFAPPSYAADDKLTQTVSYNYLYDLANDYSKDTVNNREMEKLSRGLVAVKVSDGVYLSWRLLDGEDAKYGSASENVSFDIYRDGEKIATESGTTNYLDRDGKADSTYYVLQSGESIGTAAAKIEFDKSTVTVTSPKAGLCAYAAKYNESDVLEKVVMRTITSEGTSSFDTGFEVDKVFLWDNMKPVNNKGNEVSAPEAVTVLSNSYFDIPVVLPGSETITDSAGNSTTYAFSAADCSAGDVDGDGEYEIIVKFVSNECDVGSAAYSGTVRFNAYKLDGTRLWENDINLGKNVFSSAHTAQFLVYDFDGDGKSEMTVQTSLGSTDAAGKYVSKASSESDIQAITDEENATTDYREPNNGRIASGLEFLTVFDGETGEAIDTISYPTARVNQICWGKNDGGNRSQRFIASVAYLDGEKPYAVYWRGYYDYLSGRTGIAGVSFDGERLSVDYQFDTLSGQPGYHAELEDYSGQGNHSMVSADVDNDGKDEIISGALCLGVDENNELMPVWCSWREHGDAHHIGDYDPTVPGLEYFSVHEHGGSESHGKTLDYGMTVYNGITGDELAHFGRGSDTGRGLMANTGAGGYYQINSAAGSYKSNGGSDFTEGNFGMGTNFRIFWDGDLYDEILDGTNISNWNGSNSYNMFTAENCSKINSTKSNPALQADLFGDWREELVYPTTDKTALRVFTTTEHTDYKIKTLMHDPVYRSGVATEQSAYNQPPHVGFYMGEEIFASELTGITITREPDITRFSPGEDIDISGIEVKALYADGLEKTVSGAALEISGYDTNCEGWQEITVAYRGKTDTFNVEVVDFDNLTIQSLPDKTTYKQGQRLDLSGISLVMEYSDGFAKPVDIKNCEVTNFDSSEVGSCTVTVTYLGKSATFDVTIEEGEASPLDATYLSTDTSTTNSTEIDIGEYYGDFTIEHNLTINSMPATGSNDRRSDAGFFFRFKNLPAYGGGWYFMPDSLNATHVWWKTGSATKLTDSMLNIGETYKFVYDFHDIGVGKAASVDIAIYDSSGNVMGSVTGLDMRTMTSTYTTTPLKIIEIFNQARDGAESSVTIDNTVISQ